MQVQVVMLLDAQLMQMVEIGSAKNVNVQNSLFTKIVYHLRFKIRGDNFDLWSIRI